MSKPQTHFDQVPLDLVKKITEARPRELPVEKGRLAPKKFVDEDLQEDGIVNGKQGEA